MQLAPAAVARIGLAVTAMLRWRGDPVQVQVEHRSAHQGIPSGMMDA